MSYKKYILTVTLNPVIDKTVHIPNFKRGRDFREESLSLSAGGKGINVSQVLAHLGVPSCATGFLAHEGETFMKEHLASEGIASKFSSIVGHVRTSLTIIDPVSAKITRIMERGPCVQRNDVAHFKRNYASLLSGAGAVVLSGRTIPGAPLSLYADLIALAHQHKVFSVFDTSGQPYPLGVAQKPSMIKPNIEEAEELLGVELRTRKHIQEAVYSLYRRGVQIVAITRGSRGAYVYNGKEMVFARPPHLRRKNPVGCGDAFIAGFLMGCVMVKSFVHCVRYAVACGAANALSIDPGTIDGRRVKKLYAQTEVRVLS